MIHFGSSALLICDLHQRILQLQEEVTAQEIHLKRNVCLEKEVQKENDWPGIASKEFSSVRKNTTTSANTRSSMLNPSLRRHTIISRANILFFVS